MRKSRGRSFELCIQRGALTETFSLTSGGETVHSEVH